LKTTGDPDSIRHQAAPGGWAGSLTLSYSRAGERTRSFDLHEGPLRVLRSLYPEGPSICHQVLVHPPGGIVGGDSIDIRIDLGPESHALITTPGATRFYRSSGPTASQTLQASVGANARLEWLPMETIAYPGTQATNRMRFALAPGAQMIGWEVLALGLPAAGQPFETGRFEQHLELPDRWLDRGVVEPQTPAGRRLMSSPLGWDGKTALATLWCACADDWTPAVRDGLLDTAREELDATGASGQGAATSPDASVIVVRLLADRVEPIWHTIRAIRASWRGLIWNLPEAAPRIWQT
jgi:urease accessory protein